MRKSRLLPLGIAIFTMFFGAGNIVTPLVLGREVGDRVWFALGGFLFTGVFIPFLGFVVTLAYEGDYKKFLGTMGKLPAFVISVLIMLLIGPLGAIPRCVTLAYTAVNWYLPSCGLIHFSFLVSIAIYFLTIRKGRLIELLGRLLGPFKLFLLSLLIISSLVIPVSFGKSSIGAFDGFLRGFKEGYFTLDLFCSIFFAGLIYGSFSKYLEACDKKIYTKNIVISGIKACLIGGGMLSLVYVGFCCMAARYSSYVSHVVDDHLLIALGRFALGDKAVTFANLMVLIACLTTAMALVAVVADFLYQDLLKGRLRYKHTLLITISLMFCVSNLGFSSIMAVIEPMALFFYPAIIMLTITNAVYKMFGVNLIRPLVFMTFIVTLFFYYGHYISRMLV